MKKLMAIAAGCLVASFAWGKSFSIDLRRPVARNGVRAMAQVVAPAVSENADFIRKVNLDAGSADVGVVDVGDELTLTLFDDVVITLTLKKQMPSPLGGDVFLAEVSGYDGVKNAVVLRTEDGLTVDIQDYHDKKMYKVISSATGVVVQEIDSKGLICGCDVREPSNLTGTRSTKPQKAKMDVSNGETASEDKCVDILVAYDKNATAWANSNGGGITNFAQMSVQKMNTVLANNGLDSYFRFRLVGVSSLVASSDDLNFTLDAATDGIGDWASIKAKRDEVGADIVTVLIDTDTAYGTTGLGWSLRTTDIESFSEYAYNCCAIRSVAQSHTMTHEVGHNMGCGHSDMQLSQPGPQLYGYSSGYYFTAGGGKYHTIMAYGTEGPGGTEVPYFSSPNHFYLGALVGDGAHDNAETLLNTFSAVAAWRNDTTDEDVYSWKVEPSEDGMGCIIVSASPKPSGVVKIPARIGGAPVVGIGECAFYNNQNITSVIMPDSVKSIGEEAFRECYGLIDVIIPDGVACIEDGAFYYCGNLANVVIGAGVTNIASQAFQHCINMTNLVIGANVKNIDHRAFAECRLLENVTIPDSVTSIGSYAFCDCECLASITIPDNVSYIDQGVFVNCSSLMNVKFGSGLLDISSGAFSGCSRIMSIAVADDNPKYMSVDDMLLTKDSRILELVAVRDDVVIPDGTKMIGSGAFSGRVNLKRVTIPDSVTHIYNGAFSGCSGLTSITIPNSVTYIGDGAFTSCSRLSIVVDDDNPSYKSLEGLLLSKYGKLIFVPCGLVGELSLPNGVTSIGHGALSDCSGLTGVTIPDSVTSIGSYAFKGCSGLTSVTIPDSVTSIEAYAFSGCSRLTGVTIPDSVTNIEYGAFAGCSGLTSVRIPSGVTDIDWYTFENCTNLVSVTFPVGLRSIGYMAFYGCSSLSGDLLFPEGLSQIGYYSFNNCRSLTSVVVPNSVIGELSAFDGCSSLKSVIIGDGVTSIGIQAFCDCSNLLDVQIGNGVTNIYQNAFGWCDALTNVVLGSSVESIQKFAFQGCGHLTSITIPASVKYLGRDIFFPCSTSLRLNEVHFLGLPPTMEDGQPTYRGINGTYQPEFKEEWESVLDANGYWYWLKMLQSDEAVRICFDANGGEIWNERDASAVALYRRGDVIGFPKVSRVGYAFDGWWTAADGGEQVAAPATVLCDLTLYAHWTVDYFTLVLNKNDGTGMTFDIEVQYGVNLPGSSSNLKWAPRRGFMFMGWSESEKSKIVYLKDKAPVAGTLLAKGETKPLYAIWQLDAKNAYAIQYIRNDGSGMVRTIGFIGGEERALNSVAALGFARRGYTFEGWALSAEDARNKKVWKTDMGIVSQPIANGKLLRVYAIWSLTPGYYSIRFNKNDGSGAWRELGYEYGKNTTLPTIEAGLGWGRPGYTFVGWRTKTEMDKGGIGIWRTDKGVTKTPIAAGKTLSIYAIWEKNSNAVAVCTEEGCVDVGTPVPVVKAVQAIAYFADGDSQTVEVRIESDGFTVVELGGSAYCGYVSDGVGELLGPDGSILLVVIAVE